MNTDIKSRFFEYVGPADSLAGYQRSYKLVLFKAIFSLKNEQGLASVFNVVRFFVDYYKSRAAQGLTTDKNVVDCIENIESCTLEQAFRVIRVNPYNYIHKAGFLYLITMDGSSFFVIPEELNRLLSTADTEYIKQLIDTKLDLYYSKIDEDAVGSKDLISKEMEELLSSEAQILARGKYIDFLKTRYFVPDERDKYKFGSNAAKRGMSKTEYEVFLTGCKLSSDKSITDDKIISFFEKYLNDENEVSVPAVPETKWIYRFASTNKMTLSALASLYGYKLIENQAPIENQVSADTTKTQLVTSQSRTVAFTRNTTLRNLTLDSLLKRITGTPTERRSIPLPCEDELFCKVIQRLNKRATGEIRTNKYLGDMRVDPFDYECAKVYLHYAIRTLLESDALVSESLFAISIVQVAIKVYDRGTFWGYFFDEVQIDNDVASQNIIGRTFYSILERYDLYRTKERNKYVPNILMHCYIPDHYVSGYFDFLYKFYDLDIDRDITRLKPENGGKEIMDGLMESIFSEEGGRAYMLSQHIGHAMSANPRSSRSRVRNHIKKLDKFFWNFDYQIHTKHRIYNLMQEWVRNNREFTTIYTERGIARRKGLRMFSYPYVFFNEAEDHLEIKIPSQSVKKERNEELYWSISGAEDYTNTCQVIESVIGYKVKETDYLIPWPNALKAYKIQLINGYGEVIKSFSIKETDIRFFDKNGYPIYSKNIKVGDVVAVSESSVQSSALIERRLRDGLTISYFQFEFEDIIKLPNGNAVIVGKEKIENGIVGKGLVENARCESNGSDFLLYNYVPHFALRADPAKISGTAIEFCGTRYRISDLDAIPFNIDDRSGDIGYFIDLFPLMHEKNGKYRIAIDIPGSISRAWNFVYIKDFNVDFEEAPYIFDPRATATFNDFLEIRNIDPACIRTPRSNSFSLEIESVGRELKFDVDLNNETFNISIPVPALFIKQADGSWSSLRPSAIWHTELPDEIELSVPYHKVYLSIDESDDDVRTLEFRRSIGASSIKCDLVKFKSYLSGSDWKDIKLQFGNNEEVTLYTVILHSRVVSVQLLGDSDAGEIIINSTIVGKSEYYADVYRNDVLIAEKVPLADGDASFSYEIENDKYQVELFELEPDDSGFGGDYYSIGKYEQALLNPYDMTSRNLRLVQIEGLIEGENVLPLNFDYYIENLQRTSDRGVYNGMMVVEKTSYFPLAAFEVKVTFPNVKDPSLAWIEFYDGDEPTNFLYDTKRKAVLQEENGFLNKKACYVRYSYLDADECIFRVDFCERAQSDYDTMPPILEFKEDKPFNTVFVRKKPQQIIRDTYISDITWSQEAYSALKITGYSTLRELSNISRETFKKWTSAEDEIVEQIARIMRNYKYYFHGEE